MKQPEKRKPSSEESFQLLNDLVALQVLTKIALQKEKIDEDAPHHISDSEEMGNSLADTRSDVRVRNQNNPFSFYFRLSRLFKRFLDLR